MDGLSLAEELAHDTSLVKLRSYQHEMLERSLERNVIVVMDTGSGKTHVAISRMRYELETTSTNRLIWFLAPSQALSLQQYEIIKQHLGAWHVKLLLGSDNIDKWTDQRLWDAVLTNVRVVVGTPAVLSDALTHGFVHMSRLALLIFDEAHHCVKDSPMNQIMKNFYHPAKAHGDHVPSLLGLTASPVISAKLGSLARIEANLDCVAITPKQHREQLELYVHPPELDCIPYPLTIGAAPPASLRRLHTAIANYDYAADPYVVQLRNASGERSRHKLAPLLTGDKDTYCLKQLKGLARRSVTLELELGPAAVHWYLDMGIKRFAQSFSKETLFLPDIAEKENRHLSKILDTIRDDAAQTTNDQPLVVAEKIKILSEVLLKHWSPTVRGIIFAEQRVLVAALALMLHQNPAIKERYRIGTFVGMSSNKSRDTALADLVDLKAQERGLTDFRNGSNNLMISTNVLEEGIDVPQCNLIICFDPPKNLVSFVQRGGRARLAGSHYIIFIREDDYKNHPQKWRSLEAEMKEAYMAENRDVQTNEDNEENLMSHKQYRVESTDALLTLANARAHLHHFCAVSCRGQHIDAADTRPVYDVLQPVESDPALFTAQVTLPNFVHRNFRTGYSTEPWPSRDMAIQDASFEAYVALHKAGLVNDNLLPLTKDFGPDEGQVHVDQPTIVKVCERLSTWKYVAELVHKPICKWSINRVDVELGGETVVSLWLWLPLLLPPIPAFPIFWNDTTTYSIRVTTEGTISLAKDSPQIHSLRHFTRILLACLYGGRMSPDEVDFAALFSPLDADELILYKLETFHDAAVLLDNSADHLRHGLIRRKGQVGHPYLFSGLSTSEEKEVEVVVTSFPKRRDFLRPVQGESAGTAYTAKQSLALNECTVDRLPGRYALAAAFLPCLLHKVDSAVLVRELQTSVLAAVGIEDDLLILEAISAPSARESLDYNRLEFLGDCVLKHFAVLQVSAQHLTWPEGYLGLEKFRIVSNNNLAKAALKVGLDKYVLTNTFTGNKWRPLYLSELRNAPGGQRDMSSKVVADVAEALIGASYVHGGLETALRCVKVLLPDEIWYSPAETMDYLLSEVDSINTDSLALLEQLIGHKFERPALLLEAITSVSYIGQRDALSYERLEFLGDAVLDMIITPHLFNHPRRLREWDMHRVRAALVNADFLGYCCMNAAVEQTSFDIMTTTGKRSGPTPRRTVRHVHLHDFLRGNNELMRARAASVAAFAQYRAAISSALEEGPHYPWPDLVAMAPIKALSDIVESVLGALFLDTRGDLVTCAAFVERMGISAAMRRILDDGVETVVPREKLGLLADKAEIAYETRKVEDDGDDDDGGEGRVSFECAVRVAGEVVGVARRCRHRKEAEVRAAWAGAAELERRGRGRKRKSGAA